MLGCLVYQLSCPTRVKTQLFLVFSGTYSWQYDQGFLQQVYQMIYKAGAEGISLATVAVSMGLQFRIARSAVRCLERTGAITGILKSRGKVRISL